MKTYYSGVDSIPIYVPIPEGGDLPERVKVNLYKNNKFERTLIFDPEHPEIDYITPTYIVVGDVRVYNPIETSWAIPAPEAFAENCYFEVVGVDYENDVVVTSEKFIISTPLQPAKPQSGGGNMEERLRNAAARVAFPLIDITTGKFYTSDTLTNLTVQGVIWSETGTPTLHTINGTPARVGPFWFLDITQAEMNVSDDYLNIMIVADEISSQAIRIKIVDELTEAKFTGLETGIAACLQASAYTAPDNTSIAAIKTKTDNLPVSPANESTLSTGIEALLNAIADCLQAADYTAPDDTAVRADIAALNNISVADITGSTTFKQLLAAAKGRFTKSSNTYTFYDTDGITALFTLTVSDTGRTVS